MSDILKQQITAALAGLPPGDHEITLIVAGRPIHLKLRRERRAAAMLVNFHGAVDRKTRTLPVFINFLPGLAGLAHQVSIADPSVLDDGATNIAWYAGDAGFDAQAVLPAMFASLADELGADRTLYFGTSGGGFAALYYAHQHPNSFAVAGNPQVAIERYHLGHAIRRYREQYWPDLGQDAPLTDVTCADLAPLYAKGFDNTVIYVQSIGDRMHFENQMMHFVAGLAQAGMRDRFLLHSDFWGKMGHIPAPRDYLRWIQAVCTSPTLLIFSNDHTALREGIAA
jgi:pimeloyl-ACP methyl ester carboxylesterase